ncbi:DNA alkylation repair protein [Rhodococcus triatomae]|uniref:3-methyladenine DNA glycosylase AlkD n=1 Tax=Rhodococcus triatomae TaxID=300028 RepID=A0A1G8JI86_9NOCA|nr:DNA alkylation repair protein [Rhodococcus triatomae]QNG19708.1 DNA alkylation repair protein [Rhodococcus triatomae]QNG24376.1 DNA alkylation repair protein [Rhodococcus triatomae]SDI30994.1 3-methyladenine DNA glycosylase AlkD [Rhodococcus triatomae]
MPSTAADVQRDLAFVADAADAAHLQRFFKTGPGEYGEGDVFLGVRVPQTRKIVRAHRDIPPAEIRRLLESPVHEHRLAGLLLLVERFERARDESVRAEVVDAYLEAVRDGHVNNWDLVDTSAPRILGAWFADRPRDPVRVLAADEDLWHRRVALLTTLGFLTRADASTTLELAEKVLSDRRDLIQKAVGWMLREVGSRVDREALTDFLDVHAAEMGRTALSYATEHLSADERAHYRAQR